MFEKLKAPLLLIGLFVSLIVLWGIFDLPPDDVLVDMVRGYFLKYDLGLVFLIGMVVWVGSIIWGHYKSSQNN